MSVSQRRPPKGNSTRSEESRHQPDITPSDSFNLASTIFEEEAATCKPGIRCPASESTGSAKPGAKKNDKRSLKILQLSDERKKQEYLAYQPATARNLYSYGIDNKGKREPRKTALSRKEEDVMFRKRAIYMMHVEEQRRREESTRREARRPAKGSRKDPRETSRRLQESGQGKNGNDEKRPSDHKSNDAVASVISKSRPNPKKDFGDTDTTFSLKNKSDESTQKDDATSPMKVDCEKQVTQEESFPSHYDAERDVSSSTNQNENESNDSSAFHSATEPRFSILHGHSKNEGDGAEENMEEDTSNRETFAQVNAVAALASQDDTNIKQPKSKPSTAEKTDERYCNTGLDKWRTFSFEQVVSDIVQKSLAGCKELTSTDGHANGEIKGKAEMGSGDIKPGKTNEENTNIGRHLGLPRVLVDKQSARSGKADPAAKKNNIIRISPETVNASANNSNSNSGCPALVTPSEGPSHSLEDQRSSDAKACTPRGTFDVQEKPVLIKDATNVGKTPAFILPKEKAPPQPAVMNNIGCGNNAEVIFKMSNVIPTPKIIGSNETQRQTSVFTTIPSAPNPSNQGNTHLTRISQVPILPGMIQCVPPNVHSGHSSTSPKPGNSLIPTPVLNPTFLVPNTNMHFLPQRTATISAGKVNPTVVPQNGILPTAPSTVVSTNTTQIAQTVIPCGLNVSANGNSRGGVRSPKSTKMLPQQDQVFRANTTRNAQLNQVLLQKPKFSHYPVPSDVGAPCGVPMDLQMLPQVRPNVEPSQGLIGYINVPVIKDDHGRVIVILPNDQTIMESKQPHRHAPVYLTTGSEVPATVGNRDYGLAARERVPLSQMQADATLSKPKVDDMVPFKTSTPKPGSENKSKSVLTNTEKGVQKDKVSINSVKSLNLTKKTSLQECSTSADVKKNSKENHGTAESVITIKDASNSNLPPKEGSSCSSSKDSETRKIPDIKELRARQRVIASKLKELRNVRVLIAGQGRMEEDECVRMVHRLKQVEELFFRRLITTSTEIAEMMKGNKDKTMTDEDSSITLLPEKKNPTPDEAKKERENSSSSEGTGKKADDRIDRLFNTAQLLRNCITALAKKKHAKDADQNAHGTRETNEQPHGSKAKAKNASPTKEEETSPQRISRNTSRRDISSTSTASMEQQSDMSIGSPQVDCFQPLPHDAGEGDRSNKIILRLQRIRSNNVSPQTSEDQTKETDHNEGGREKPDEIASTATNGDANGIQVKIEIKEEESSLDTEEGIENPHLTTGGGMVSNDEKFLAQNGHALKINANDEKHRGVEESQDIKTEDVFQKSTRLTNPLKKNEVLFKGPSKDRLREDDEREREIVKQAWNKSFPKTTPIEGKCLGNEGPTDSREQTNSSSYSNEKSTQQKTKMKNKETRHIHGNPTIRGNLTSIGSINTARQVGGSNETKFQWLLKQLQKKRNGNASAKPKNQLRSQGTGEQPHGRNSDEEAREYVLLVSRGTQSEHNLRKLQKMKPKSNAMSPDSAGTAIKDTYPGAGKFVSGCSLEESLPDVSREVSNSSADVDYLNTEEGKKKRGRDSTGSTNKPQEKLPRVYSPISDFGGDMVRDRSTTSNRDEELDDLIALREEVLSRQSSSSGDTIGYTDSLISLVETTRRVKGTSPQKKKVRSAGTMTMPPTNKKSVKQSGPKKSPCPAEKRFATKSRGHNGYGWIRSKVKSHSKNKGKKTKGGKPKKNTKPKVNAIMVVSDDSESSDGYNQEKEMVEAAEPKMKRRNTLASLSARLWDECYWSTLNDKTNDTPGFVRKTLPSNNSPPSTRKTGLEAKMLEQWGDLLRYSGNRQDDETFPVTVEELDKMNLPPAVATPMRVLLEGYEIAQQSTKVVQDDAESNASYSNTGLNENNSAEVRSADMDETAQANWEHPTEEMSKDTDGLSSRDGIISSEWESSRSTDLTLETLTSHGSNDSRKTYNSSSAPQSPPALEAEVDVPSEHQPENNLRRWQTSQHLATGSNGNGPASPDYSADNMNSNRCHEEGDSARSVDPEAGSFSAGTFGWRIGCAGDLREPRSISAAMNPARNRRRQNRAITWYSHADEQDDPDDDIPLARLVERDRSAKTLISSDPKMESNSQPNRSRNKLLENDSPEADCCDNSCSSESFLPGPFILDYQTRLESFDENNPGEDGNRNGDACAEADHQGPTTGNQQQVKKRVGKLLFGTSKKGKSLVKKGAGPSRENDNINNKGLPPGGETTAGKRYVIDCRADDDRKCHAFYREDSSPDVFE